jgi:hypothetical protein
MPSPKKFKLSKTSFSQWTLQHSTKFKFNDEGNAQNFEFPLPQFIHTLYAEDKPKRVSLSKKGYDSFCALGT